MSTVGYGDFCAQTPAGRFLSFIAILCGAILVAFLVATVSDNLKLKPEEMKVINQIEEETSAADRGSAAQKFFCSNSSKLFAECPATKSEKAFY